MNPFSILMFCFSGMLMLYAALLALTGDDRLIPRRDAAKVKDRRAYATRFATVLALVAVAPAHCGIVALFSAGWAVAVLLAECVLALWLGTWIMKGE